MTNDDLWQPELEKTQWVPPRRSEPVQGRGPEPVSSVDVTESVDTGSYDAETHGAGTYDVRSPGAESYFETASYAQQPRPRRRRVLFALGGLTLVAGVGAAAVVEAASGGRSKPQAAGGGRASSPGVPGTQTPGGTAAASPSASAPASQSASASATPSTSWTDGLPPADQVAKAPQWYVDNEGPMAIALTMDDGPSKDYTPQVLEIFRQYGIKATFNMVGNLIHPNLSLVREVSAEGHTITNHTWNHADLSRESYSQVCSQIDRCNDALADANQHPTIFRAPYGNWSKAVFQACASRRLRPVGWTVDPRDWDTAHVDAAEIVQNVLRHTSPHSIILEHDGGGDRSNTVAALKIFIPELLSRGYHFVAM